MNKKWDVFISHASEDKDSVARPLAEELAKRSVEVWYDEFALKLGDSLRRSIDEGLANSKYGIVILSHSFFNKEWPQVELDALATRQAEGEKVILPVWHNVTQEEVKKHSPILADRVAAQTSRGIPSVVNEIIEVLTNSPQVEKAEHKVATPNNLEKNFDILWKQIDDLLASFRNLVLGWSQTLQKRDKDDSLTNLEIELENVYQNWREQRFQVAVLALIKSGKSTLINAFLGDEFLPIFDRPETARIVHVRHNRDEKNGILHTGENKAIQKASDINAYLKELNAKARSKATQAVTEAKQSKYSRSRTNGSSAAKNTLALDGELILEACFESLKTRFLEQQAFEIIDTPGANEAKAGMLRDKVFRLLNDVDVIIYLLDYTKLDTKDEAEMFTELKGMLRSHILKSNDERMFFVINKIDQWEPGGSDRDQIAHYVADLLYRDLGLKIAADRILFVSAKKAFLARLILNERASPEQVERFDAQAFNEFEKTTRTFIERKKRALRMLDNSHLPELEERVLLYIYAHRSRIFLENRLTELSNCIHQFYNYLSFKLKVLKTTNKTSLKRQLKQLEIALTQISEGFDSLENEVKRFKKNVRNWVEKKFDTLNQEINEMIQSPYQNYPGHDEFRDKICQLMGKTRIVRSKRKRVIQKVEDNVNSVITNYLQITFDEFRLSLEQQILDKQKSFLTEIEHIIQSLNQQVEGKVNQIFEIPTMPVSVRFALPSLEKFHRQIESLVYSESNKQRTRRKIEVPDKKRVKVLRDGFWGKVLDFFFPKYEFKTVYVKKHTKIAITYKTYNLSYNSIQTTWLEEIENIIEDASLIVQNAIDEQIIGAIEKIRNNFEKYSTMYEDVIKREIEKGQDAEARRKQDIYDAETSLKTVQGFLDKLRIFQDNFDLYHQPVKLS